MNENLDIRSLSESIGSRAEYIRAQLEDKQARELVAKAKRLSAKIANLKRLPKTVTDDGTHAPIVSDAALSWAMKDIRLSMNQAERRRHAVRKGLLARRHREPRIVYSPDAKPLSPRAQIGSREPSSFERGKIAYSNQMLRDDEKIAEDDGIISSVLRKRRVGRRGRSKDSHATSLEADAGNDDIDSNHTIDDTDNDGNIHIRVVGGCHSACAPACCGNDALIHLIERIVTKDIGSPGVSGAAGIAGNIYMLRNHAALSVD